MVSVRNIHRICDPDIICIPSYQSYIILYLVCFLVLDETSPGAIPQYKERMPYVTHSPEIMDSSELRPFSKPEVALIEALRLLADEDW